MSTGVIHIIKLFFFSCYSVFFYSGIVGGLGQEPRKMEDYFTLFQNQHLRHPLAYSPQSLTKCTDFFLLNNSLINSFLITIPLNKATIFACLGLLAELLFKSKNAADILSPHCYSLSGFLIILRMKHKLGIRKPHKI